MKRKSDLALSIIFLIFLFWHLLDLFAAFRGERMEGTITSKNHLKEIVVEANLSQAQLAEMVGVSRNTISSIETGQFNPTAKLAP